jgi:hypothetical protein
MENLGSSVALNNKKILNFRSNNLKKYYEKNYYEQRKLYTLLKQYKKN